MNPEPFDRLLAFLKRLDKAGIKDWLHNHREGALSVLAHAPGEFWKIDFLDDGPVDAQRFRSDGWLGDEAALEDLFAVWGEIELSEAVKERDAIARQ
jgi:hypothetical protein